MAYSSITYVQARIPGFTIDGSSKPTSTQVGYWIEEADVKIDAALRIGGYALPVTDATDVLILRDLATSMVTARVEAARYDGQDDEESVNGRNCRVESQQMLKELKSGDMIFVNTEKAVSTGTSWVPRSYQRTHSDDDDIEPILKKDDDY